MDFFTQLLSSLFAGILTNKISKQHINNAISIDIDSNSDLDISDTKTDNNISISQDNIKGRITFAIELLRRIDTDNRLTSTAIAYDLGLDDLEKVDLVVQGQMCPDMQFVKLFSKQYNINEEWLISGDSDKRKPYSHCSNYMHDATGIPTIYKNGQYNSMYVCTTDHYKRWTCIVLVKPDGYMVAHCESNWCMSNHIGAGGRMQLVALYKALTSFGSYNHNVYGLRVTIDEFNTLTSGEAHINDIKAGKRIDYMWEDFLDINRKNMGNLDYEKEYGAEFISAQDNVSYYLDKQRRS